MAITTTYKCDKCGKEQNTREQFWTVGVSASCSQATSKYDAPYFKMEVCRACLESFGIYAQKVKEPEQQQKTPTLEELIIDIVMNAEIN